MTLDDDILGSGRWFFRESSAPYNVTEIMVDDLLKGKRMKADEKQFFANIGAYVAGEMQDLGITITRETFLEYAPCITEEVNCPPLEKAFFEKVIDAAVGKGYLMNLVGGELRLSKGEGTDVLRALRRKGARYNKQGGW